MARFIDADKLALKWMNASPKQRETFRQIIDEEPTADVVEVVRCKDCRYRDEMCMCSHPKQEGILPLTYPLDFCSYGERRDT